uniref:Peptidase A2 domain-containing protein n=1 Tax=Ditylenchus dipsaci TaxID=166011 RepID=A0A915E656_9BILA
MNPEVLQQILQQQQQQFLAALQAMQVQAPPLPANAQPNPAPIDRLMQSLSLRLSEFVYDPDENDTFDRWYARYQDVFTADAEVLDDATKARLLVSRLGKTEFQRFANNILPQQPRDISFDDTVAKLQSLFAPTHSLFNRRYKCLQLVRDSSTDVVTFSGIVNKQCELFQLDALTTEQFKALVFISALKNPSDAELRLQCLKKLETTPTATLQELVQVCHRYQTFKEDLQMLDNPSAIRSADVSALRQSRSEAKNQRSSSQRPRSSSQYRARSSSRPLPKHARPCRFCQGHHWDKDCRQASSPSRRPRQTQLPWKPSTGSIWISHLSLPPSSLPRVFQVLQVKGSPVKFQVDSGADISLINKETWVSLGQPTLRPARVSGTSADASPIRFLGVFQCRISLHNSSFHGTLYVVRNGKNLMGLDFMVLSISPSITAIRKYKLLGSTINLWAINLLPIVFNKLFRLSSVNVWVSSNFKKRIFSSRTIYSQYFVQSVPLPMVPSKWSIKNWTVCSI